MTEKQLTDDLARRRKLDELFADQPFLSTTMRAARLHDRMVEDLPPLPIPARTPAREEAINLRLVDGPQDQALTSSALLFGGEPDPILPESRTVKPAPSGIGGRPARNEVAQTARMGAQFIHVPADGQVRLELLLDLGLKQATVKPVAGGALEAEILTLAEGAEFLRVSQGTLRTLVKEGRLPCAYIGRRPRFRRSALIAFLKENEREENSRSKG